MDDLRVGHGAVVGNSAHDRDAALSGQFFKAERHGQVQIGLVDDQDSGNAKLARKLRNALEVVFARNRGLHDEQGQAGAGQRSDDRAADAGRTVAQDQVAVAMVVLPVPPFPLAMATFMDLTRSPNR